MTNSSSGETILESHVIAVGCRGAQDIRFLDPSFGEFGLYFNQIGKFLLDLSEFYREGGLIVDKVHIYEVSIKQPVDIGISPFASVSQAGFPLPGRSGRPGTPVPWLGRRHSI